MTDPVLDEIRRDRQSGASALVRRALPVLRKALLDGDPLPAARALCAAQPAMAPLWNAALHAVAAAGDGELFERFARRVERAPGALVRFALDLFAGARPPLRIVTVSSSGAVRAIVAALQQTTEVEVSCGEGRPGLEGRGLAAGLAGFGVKATLYTDAALALALDGADALLVGADAVGSEAFLNKTGTFATAAAAALKGVPVYVAAARDKFVMPALWPHLSSRLEAAAEVWDSAPAAVTVCNPYFEPVPVDLGAAFVTDAGVLDAGAVPQVCQALQTERMSAALERLLAL